MDQNQNSGAPLFQLNLDATNSYTLRSAASWGRVLGVVGIIMGLLFFVFGIMMQTMIKNMESMSTYRNEMAGNTQMAANLGLVMYIFIGILVIVASMFVLNFGNKTLKALKTNDQAALSAGFAGARNYFAFWAILSIISLLLMVIGLAGILTQSSSM
jgi:hypothetical protein